MLSTSPSRRAPLNPSGLAAFFTVCALVSVPELSPDVFALKLMPMRRVLENNLQKVKARAQGAGGQYSKKECAMKTPGQGLPRFHVALALGERIANPGASFDCWCE